MCEHTTGDIMKYYEFILNNASSILESYNAVIDDDMSHREYEKGLEFVCRQAYKEYIKARKGA